MNHQLGKATPERMNSDVSFPSKMSNILQAYDYTLIMHAILISIPSHFSQ